MFQSCRCFCSSTFLQRWLCPRCDKAALAGRFGQWRRWELPVEAGESLLETQGLQCWQVPPRALQGRAVPGRNNPGSRSGCPQQSEQLSGAVPHGIPVGWACSGCCYLRAAVGVLMGLFLPWGEHLSWAKGWVWEGVRESEPLWVSPALQLGPEGFPGRGWRLLVPPLSLSVCSGENAAGREAGAKHVTGRTLLPIKLQTVSQEITFLRWSCFSQAFGLCLCVPFVVFLRDRPSSP